MITINKKDLRVVKSFREEENYLNFVSVDIRPILKRALEGERPTLEELEILLKTKGRDAFALYQAADELRERLVGNDVSFVINRNLNFTNICYKGCRFCAFSAPKNSRRAYFYLDEETFRQKIEEVKPFGITEVCVQAGIHPDLTFEDYLNVLRIIKKIDPNIHIHAYSPEEIMDIHRKTELPFEDILKELKNAGLDSLPGTAAEILVDEVRAILCPEKITTETWIEIIRTAHHMSIPTTSTIMFGHIESFKHRALHLKRLLELQLDTGGFTEFVPLPFVHQNTPLNRQGLVTHAIDALEVLNMYATARLYFQEAIPNIQVSWVKLGWRMMQMGLMAGCNDVGGTLFEEHITSAANDGEFGDHMYPSELVTMIKQLGRIPVQRSTVYQILKRFS